MAREGGRLPEAANFTVAQVCDLFLDWSHKHNDARTYGWYKDFLQDFCDFHGGLRATQLKPFHVTQWLDRHHGWNDGSRRCAITAVKRAFNWAADEGVLHLNPIKKVRKPPARSRDRILTPQEKAEILGAVKDQQFRDFIFAMQETGCRPSEVARVTATDVDLQQGTWTLQKHKTRKKTGKPRVVYLTPAMVELTKRLIEEHPTGPLFRGPRGGQPFTPNGLRCRFRRLREKLPHLKGVISYTYRHSFVRDKIWHGMTEDDVDVILKRMAFLKGPIMLDILLRHYTSGWKVPTTLEESSREQLKELSLMLSIRTLILAWTLPFKKFGRVVLLRYLTKELDALADRWPADGGTAALTGIVRPDDFALWRKAVEAASTGKGLKPIRKRAGAA